MLSRLGPIAILSLMLFLVLALGVVYFTLVAVALWLAGWEFMTSLNVAGLILCVIGLLTQRKTRT